MDVSNSRSRGARAIALGASVTLNIVLLAVVLWPDAEPAEAPAALAVADELEPSAPEVVAPVAVAAVDAPAAPEKAPAVDPAADVQVTIASLEGSLPQTMAIAAEPYGDFVSATLSRLLVWDLDLRRDLRPKDTVEAMWTLGTSDTVVIQAARYQAQKFNKTVAAYRFQATGDEYASYWAADGTEIPHRLRNSPLQEYEQITSLLRDRPTHHGMDFKVAVGTPVVSSFDGVVTRVNWNWAANGNCVEIRHNDGVLAKYLHLSENKVKEGARVSAGEVIALSGNTGRSTGPHLHYQLNRGKQVVDPIDYHGTDRRSLPAGDREAFAKVVADADARLDAARTLAVN